MFKINLILILILLSASEVKTQERGVTLKNSKPDSSKFTGNTYAVVVGISNYKFIQPLSFADEDAYLFKDFLKSKAGGNIPEDNILLLVNDDAKASTLPRIRHWIGDIKKPKTGDKVYFYFAGHGDAIDADEYFFLLQDCNPAGDKNNYVGGMASALPMYSIKSFIKNNLIAKGVNTILIWDACRTNELPGGTEGMKIAQQGIAEKTSGETIMLSASAGETAIENNQYAHGHGLFTYYLIDGFSGAADNADLGGNGDGKIDLSELEIYVKMKVSRDAKKKFKSTQNPKLVYNKDATIAIVDEDYKKAWALQKQSNENFAYNTPKKSRAANDAIDTVLTNLYNQIMQEIKLDSFDGNNGAEALLAKMEQQFPNNNLTQEAGFNLAMEYINLVQDRINLYLSGNDDLRGMKEEEKNKLTKKVHLTLDRACITNANYLKRAITLLKNTGTDDTLFVNQLVAKENFFRGRSYYKNENIIKSRTEALDYAFKALQLQPNAAYNYHLIGLLYVGEKNYDSAIYYEKKSIALAPNWSYSVSLMGDIYRGMKKYDSAIYYYQIGAKGNKIASIIYNNWGCTYTDMGQVDSAKYYFKKSIAEFPKTEFSYENLAVIYTNQKLFDSAKYYYFLGINNLDDKSYAYNCLGVFFQEQKQYDSALLYFNKSLSINPKNIITYQKIGFLYQEKEQYDSARMYLYKLVRIDSLDEKGYVNLGNIFLEENKTDSAKIFYRKALKLNNHSSYALYYFARFLQNKKIYDSAIYYYRLILKINKIDEDALDGIGSVYFQLNQNDSALCYYKQVITLNPNYRYGFNNVATVFREMNQLDSAIFYYGKAVLINNIDENEDNYLNLGDLQDERDKRIECYYKVIQLNPKNQQAYIRLAYEYFSLKQYDSAKYYFSKKLVLDSNATYVFFYLGHIYQQKAVYDSAAMYYKISLSKNFKSMDACNYLGYLYLKKIINYDSAFYYFNKEIEIDNKSTEGYYDMACYYSYKKNEKLAIDYLEKTIAAGFNDYKILYQDKNLAYLITTEAFKAFIKKYYVKEKD